MKRFSLLVLACAFMLCSVVAQTVPDGVYLIRYAANPNYVLDLSRGIAANTSNVHLWTYRNATNQKWLLKHVGKGKYVICSMVDKQFVLDVDHGKMANGTNIFVHQYKGGANQLWYIVRSGNAFTLRSVNNHNFAIDLDHQRQANGTNIQLWRASGSPAQKWRLERVSSSGGSVQQNSIPQSYNGRQTRLCRNCKGSAICNLCKGTGKMEARTTDLYGRPIVNYFNCVCVDQTKNPGKCISCNGYKFEVKYGESWLPPTDSRVSSPRRGVRKACTHCNGYGLVQNNLWCNDCMYNIDLSWHKKPCQTCGKNHCYLQDRHDTCPMCGGTGYVND